MSLVKAIPEDLHLVKYEITQMMESDLNDVVSLEESTGLSRWGYESYRQELFNNPSSIMRTARGITPISVYRKVLGFVASRVIFDELHINNVATDPTFRRIRIGTTLMESVIKESRIYGARRCLLEVRANNVSAQILYKKMGFEMIGRRRDYYTMPTEDALVMQFLY
ncbi:MAG: ribosomal protein S18-alanine N-acetyltransferase [Acidobacteria bacterium]|nr:ribosomal protein S18-alanine N-acetyltransferase [Acidobacteriota bacterium]